MPGLPDPEEGEERPAEAVDAASGDARGPVAAAGTGDTGPAEAAVTQADPAGKDSAATEAPDAAASPPPAHGAARPDAPEVVADEPDPASTGAASVPAGPVPVPGDVAVPEAAATESGLPEPDPALFAHALRLAEALVFASDRPVTPQRLQQALPPGVEARAVLTALAARCADRPVQLVEVAGGFAFRTAPELAPALTRVVEVPRRLPRAAMETLAIIAYHQPVTRAEIEEIRGASLSQTTLESLLEMGLVAPRGRKEVPGRPSLWGTTPKFLEQFGLRALTDLPRREELVNEPGAPLLAPLAASPSA
ncbi:SMC-Scp complex subunit ScpB [Paracraurococcus ruber]|uniref:SMC-Scp complex subunit ScpB n=1 Tax=Paracraurococcus ruber TaxID=77675 RepID=A0ABS1D4P7_9PROT|nr:SMC-Scp complex subunit ScpB [Paracraurococcus ruber]TDG27278.1 SMC-Scp complex subunit ScpB [Paracraurococcus ruber]